MRSRSIVVAVTAVTALILASCSTSISGSAQAADPLPAASNVDPGDLELPGEADEIPGLGDLLEGLSGDGDAPDLGALLGGDGDGPDLGALLNGLGDGEGLNAVPGLAGILGEECLAVAGATMSIGMLLLGATMGSSLTQHDVDSAFDALGGMPDELAADIDLLHRAALSAVGDSGAAAKLMSDPDVTAAMDNISAYMDDKCGPAE